MPLATRIYEPPPLTDLEASLRWYVCGVGGYPIA